MWSEWLAALVTLTDFEVRLSVLPPKPAVGGRDVQTEVLATRCLMGFSPPRVVTDILHEVGLDEHGLDE